jgi:hypothetical protein
MHKVYMHANQFVELLWGLDFFAIQTTTEERGILLVVCRNKQTKQLE